MDKWDSLTFPTYHRELGQLSSYLTSYETASLFRGAFLLPFIFLSAKSATYLSLNS